jgi:hypothetical protein
MEGKNPYMTALRIDVVDGKSCIAETVADKAAWWTPALPRGPLPSMRPCMMAWDVLQYGSVNESPSLSRADGRHGERLD